MAVSRLLVRFYQAVERRLEFKGALAPTTTKKSASILQGCPLSPLALVALMTEWHRALRDSGALAWSYFEDRTIAASGPHAAAIMKEACKHTEHFDNRVGFSLNRGKCQLRDPGNLLQNPEADDRGEIWPRPDAINILGLHYRATDGEILPLGTNSHELDEVIARRATRIRVAANQRQHLKNLFGCLVQSLVLWASPFALPAPKLRLCLDSEATCTSTPNAGPGTSKLLLQAVGVGTMDMELRWLCRGIATYGRWVQELRGGVDDDRADLIPVDLLARQFTQIAPKLESIMSKYNIIYDAAAGGWIVGGERAAFVYGMHPASIVDRWIEKARERRLLADEPRAKMPEQSWRTDARPPPDNPVTLVLVLDAHEKWVNSKGRRSERNLALTSRRT